VYPIIRFLSLFFITVEFRNPDGMAKIVGKPAVIIANHIAPYDSFLLRLNKHWTSLSVFFMGVTRFNALHMRILWYTGIIPVIFFLFGVFVVVPGRGLEKNLEAPRDILAKGGNRQVFIFPEGSMNTTGVLKPFKAGAATLISMTGVPVLPISYKVIRTTGIRTKITRQKIIITIGEVMDFVQGTDPLVINQQLEGRVVEMLAG
jgi:1-acyl-sn-glycerol-3-phosphate acyltransferase